MEPPLPSLCSTATGLRIQRQIRARRGTQPHTIMVGIIPGWGRFASNPKVMAVIDTSGSMSEPMLADISAELGLMSQRYEVTVVECDVAVHAVYPYRPISEVHGRGGTSFLEPLAADFLRKQGPDLVVYFTDGYGPAPANPPSVPVIWCITEGGVTPAKWGQEIRMKEPNFGPHVPNSGPPGPKIGPVPCGIPRHTA